MVDNVANLIIGRCIFVVVFYTFICSIYLIVLARFRNNQKKYEDMILGVRSVSDNSKLDLSDFKGTDMSAN